MKLRLDHDDAGVYQIIGDGKVILTFVTKKEAAHKLKKKYGRKKTQGNLPRHSRSHHQHLRPLDADPAPHLAGLSFTRQILYAIVSHSLNHQPKEVS